LLLPLMVSYLAFALSSSSATTTEIFKGATVVETFLEKVDDFLVGDIDYSGAFVEKVLHVFAQNFTLFLLHHG
jgi:hypothetical protein